MKELRTAVPFFMQAGQSLYSIVSKRSKHSRFTDHQKFYPAPAEPVRTE